MQIFHTVRYGDTIYGLSKRFSIPLNALISANSLYAPYTIYQGQQLSMPPGVSTYVVKPGDTLFRIAQRYDVPASRIAEASAIDTSTTLIPGMVLNVPAGVPYYVVKPGDTLYKLAIQYNVMVDGVPRPDLIQLANNNITPAINPGMKLMIPFPPAGGEGRLAAVYSDETSSYIGIYAPLTGRINAININRLLKIDEVNMGPNTNIGRDSSIYWSPDKTYLAFVDNTGVISLITTKTGKAIKIDQAQLPGFVDWSYDGKQLVYSNGKVIRIFHLESAKFFTISRAGASYVQWFPNSMLLLFEAKDASGNSQLYTIKPDGSGERPLTKNLNSPMHWVRLSPNGRFVLYTSPGASISEIYTVELSTGKQYRLPSGPEAKNYYPAWSPDSSKIAYCSTQFIGGRYYSWVRYCNPRGDGGTIIALSSCYSTPLTWSQDSTRISYLSGCREDTPPVEVWSINIKKPFPTNILSGFFFYSIDWSTYR